MNGKEIVKIIDSIMLHLKLLLGKVRCFQRVCGSIQRFESRTGHHITIGEK